MNHNSLKECIIWRKCVHGNWFLVVWFRDWWLFHKTGPNRTNETLQVVIRRRIRPGTNIVSDCWALYNGLKLLGHDHKTFQKFRQSNYRRRHSKSGKYAILYQSEKIKKCGTKRRFLFGCFSKFIWKKRITGNDPFANLISGINNLFNFK